MYNKKTKILVKKISAFMLIATVICGFIIIRNYEKPVITKAESCAGINYFNNFDIFVSNLISYDDFSEYFKDIFSRNPCQRDDIFMLETQIQKQSKLIRQAYENCNSGILNKLVPKVYELQVELMYLRKFALNNPDKADDQPELIPYETYRLYSDLSKEFVTNKKIYKQKDFDLVYNQIATKYESKLDAYNNCVDVSWKDLTDKWNEFIDMRAGMTPAIDRMKQSIQNKEKKINEAPPKNRGGLIERLFAIGINGLDLPQGLDEINKEFAKNMPSSSNTGGGFNDIINRYSSESARYDTDKEASDVLTKYRFLYRDDADESIKTLVDKIDELNKTIEDTFASENNLFKCAKAIQLKQCTNKQ